MRAALADGWGGSMIATDLSDILFGTPNPLVSQVNLGVLKEDEVNIVVHGHEPTLSEMIVAATTEPELIAYAESKGAKGINLAGICCTGNETLMRQGVPSAGNFLHQELAIITGAVEAMVVDVQCIMQALPDLASQVPHQDHHHLAQGQDHRRHPRRVRRAHARSTSPRQIVRHGDRQLPEPRRGADPRRRSATWCPGSRTSTSTTCWAASYRSSFRPLNDAIMSGRIRGVVADVGCNNPRTTQDATHDYIVRELLKNDVLVVETGCGAIASGKYGFLLGEAAMEWAGPGLREVCEAIGMPPVLHMGSCVDNTRILTVLTQMVNEGGLGDDISDIPAVGIAPEWMSEKALAIASYCACLGRLRHLGHQEPGRGQRRW